MALRSIENLKLSIKMNFVISGGTSGVARHVVIELVKQGHNVVFGDIGDATCLLDELKYYTGKAFFIFTDVSKVQHCERLFKYAYENLNRIDGFFSYAGITPIESLLDCTEQVYDSIFNINVKGAIFCSKYATKYMIESGGGSIVFTGSPHAWSGEFDRASYACSKGAVVTLSNHIARNYGKYNIRSNYITLGWTPTEGELALRETQGLSEIDLHEQAKSIIPMGRMNVYDDIVPAIIYLLSDQSKMTSGSNIRITGGWYM
jgi:NAD(P)-dependent dehydrogenase (short-subunit alcohol dehydrogenase family)